MTQRNPVRVAVNGFGVIGKRVVDAVRVQDDMELVGVSDIASDWRLRSLEQKAIPFYAASDETVGPMRDAGLPVAGMSFGLQY